MLISDAVVGVAQKELQIYPENKVMITNVSYTNFSKIAGEIGGTYTTFSTFIFIALNLLIFNEW
jgi:hypothetical protein